MVGPGGWATVARKTRADQIQRRTVGRDKCENITDGKSKHPAQILEASVVHDRSGGRASFLSCELGGWDCQPFWDPHVDVPFLSQALSPFPPIVGTGKPAQFSLNLIAVGEPPPRPCLHCLGGGWPWVFLESSAQALFPGSTQH